jgi:hypothetical protein
VAFYDRPLARGPALDIIGVDCSDDANDQRQQLLDRLIAQLYGGVTNVSDRGRSVSYADATKLIPLITQLKREQTFCLTGIMPARGRRYFYVPLVKCL